MKRAKGVSLIELVVTLVVLAILIMLGAPSISEWIQNSQIRTASESIMTGLQAARNEAVRQNRNVEFRLTNPTSTGGTGWLVKFPGTADNDNIQSAAAGEGSRSAIATPTPVDGDRVTFTGLGRTPDPPGNINTSDGSALLTQIDIDSSVLSASVSRNLRILITPGGMIRMCDPNVSSSATPPDTRACP